MSSPKQKQVKLFVNTHEKSAFLNTADFVPNFVMSSNSFIPFPISLCAFGAGAYKN